MGFGRGHLDWARDGADWPNREASRFVRAAGLTWHVQRMGAGPTVLLIHGTGGATHSWRGVAPLLAERFDVIAPDLPGHAFTPAPRQSALSLPNMASGLGALLAALEAEPAIVVGHSAGAAIAARMALDGAAAPSAIVSFNGAFLPFRGLAGQLFPSMAKLLALNPFAPRAFAWSADRIAVERIAVAIGSPLGREGAGWYRRLLASPSHISGMLGMMAFWDLKPLMRDLARLQPHLELVVGETDRAVPPSDAREIAARAPRCHVTPLPGLGHLAHEERPDLAADIVVRVASEVSGLQL
ncbi:MAG: alpha/beta fold hydrolase [Rhodobacteraceae bacterium]|nr:MAG: alpha/beta fold hydrolase [Paracoccaceae bacterium]